MLPLVGRPAPSPDAVRYRTVTATGRYDAAHQGLVRLRSVDGDQGYFVLTPLVTPRATLLVVRGFVAERGNGSPPTSIAAPPTGRVTVTGRAQTPDPRHDSSDGIPAGQLWSVNPGDQAARLGTAVYDGYVELVSGQPGTAGITAVPAPDLSNPAGGAVEPQHFAYIIQWYLFAVLALAAPFAMARAERREQRADADDVGGEEFGAREVSGDTPSCGDAEPGPSVPMSDEERRAAKLADRYGRPVH